MSNKLGAFDGSFRNRWFEKNDFGGLEDSVGVTAPNQTHANCRGQIFENSQSFSPPVFNGENIEQVVGCGSSSEPNSLLPESPTNIELEEWDSENFRTPLVFLATSSTEARTATLEEDQLLIESKRQESHLENSPTVWERGVSQDRQALTGLKKSCLVMSPKWNNEEENQLIQLVAEGKDWLEIGNLLNRSPEATKLRHQTLTRNSHAKRSTDTFKKKAKWKTEEIANLFRYRAQGISWKDIGNDLGRLPVSVKHFYRRRIKKEEKNPNFYLHNKASLESMNFLEQPGKIAQLETFSVEKWLKDIEQMFASDNEDDARIEDVMPLGISEALQDRSWTKEETNTLMQFKNIKSNWSKVAESLGKNITDVKIRYWSIVLNGQVTSSEHFSSVSWTKEEEEKLIEYKSQEKTWEEIGTLLGRTDKAVSSHYRVICRRKARSEWTEEDEKKLIEYRAEGKQWLEIGARLGRLIQEVSDHYEVIGRRRTEVRETSEPSFEQYLVMADEYLEKLDRVINLEKLNHVFFKGPN